MNEVYRKLKSDLEKNLNIQHDRPEETIDSTLMALWHKAAGNPVSVEHAMKLSLPLLTEREIIHLNQLITQRLNGMPTAYITGRQKFMDIEFLSDSRALIPRKETEILGHKALELCKKLYESRQYLNVLDVCCGSGNLGLAIAHFFPHVSVYASDLSKEAVDLTNDNISHLNLIKQVKACQSDLFSAFETNEYYKKLDLIVCNPPYISSSKVAKMNPETSKNEPSMAFDGGMTGFKVIQKLIQETPKFLSEIGWLIFEVGVGQGPLILQLLENSQAYREIGYKSDNIDNIRVVFASC